MGGLTEGERVLIHAAAGGVGISATQIAKRIGAEMFGTASASKHDAIREQGVDHPIDYRSQDFARRCAGSPAARGSTWPSTPSARRASARTTGCCVRGAAGHVRGLGGADRARARSVATALRTPGQDAHSRRCPGGRA